MALLSSWQDLLPNILESLSTHERSALELSVEIGTRNVGPMLLTKYGLDSKENYHQHLVLLGHKIH